MGAGADKILERIKPGSVFGMLTVRHTWRNANREPMADCECECGRPRTVRGWDLVYRNKYTHCGCHGVRVGQVYGEMTVRSVYARAPMGSDRYATRNLKIAILVCACGRTREVSCGTLVGRLAVRIPGQRWLIRCTPGCSGVAGCTSMTHEESAKLSCTSSRWENIRSGARERGIPIEVDRRYVSKRYDEQAGMCALTGVALKMQKRNAGGTASLDRIDSSRGYIPGNVQWVHAIVNVMKNSMTVDEFRIWCRAVVDHASASPTLPLVKQGRALNHPSRRMCST